MWSVRLASALTIEFSGGRKPWYHPQSISIPPLQDLLCGIHFTEAGNKFDLRNPSLYHTPKS
jgi:hypothetical protein